jgi:hypothetical protein
MPKKDTRPKSSRPRFPKQYGVPKTPAGMLPWSFIEERMSTAKNYWLSTTRPDGRPHARPIDGVWLDGILSFGGGETQWIRNLQTNPNVCLHLDRSDEVVILEGKAERVEDPKHPLADRVLEASREKYPEYYPGTGKIPFRPFWIFRPAVAFAWTLQGFPKSATRFHLAEDEAKKSP